MLDQPHKGVSTPVQPRGVRRALESMRADPGRDWSVPDLAAVAGVSSRTLQRMFQVFLGKAPRAVLRDIFAFLDVDPDHPIDLSRRHNETVAPRLPALHAFRHRLFGDAPALRWLPVSARSALRRLYHRRRADITMDPADREMVIDYYRDEITRTADLIGRDLSAWLGNAMQSNALHELYKLEGMVKEKADPVLLADWRKLTTSDHFYYMCTKYWADGDVHKYFSPYESPYDSYINFMNVLDNVRSRAKN